jgi:hypothetical protein
MKREMMHSLPLADWLLELVGMWGALWKRMGGERGVKGLGIVCGLSHPTVQ